MAEQIVTLERDTNVGGLLMTFVDYVPDLKIFGEKVLPLVREKYAAPAGISRSHSLPGGMELRLQPPPKGRTGRGPVPVRTSSFEDHRG